MSNIKELQLVIALLEQTNKEASKILSKNPENEGFEMRVSTSLNTLCNALKSAAGIDLGEANLQTKKEHAPLTKMFGKSLKNDEKKVVKKEVKPTTNEKDNLLKKAIELTPKFAETESKDIISLYSDVEIRAVAKSAGMDVDVKTPEKITVQFIDELKTVINENAEKAAVVEKAKANATKPTAEKAAVVEK